VRFRIEDLGGHFEVCRRRRLLRTREFVEDYWRQGDSLDRNWVAFGKADGGGTSTALLS
jgi:hypothetical protein